MGRITSNVGLVTGLPITDTVDQLMQVAGAPRDLLLSRTRDLQSQQLAIGTLSTRLLSLKFDLSKLNVAKPYQARTVASQNEEVLTATLASDGQPPLGSYPIRPAQTASSQQLISQRFESLDDVAESGVLSFAFGGFVDKGISLDELNGGSGVARGEIKLTDLAGNSSVIDLTLARSVDDVLEAINNDTTVSITASIDRATHSGDAILLTDTSGGGGTLSVQEVAGGTTAADLGLAGISTASTTATGGDLFTLHAGTKLARLNDGNGVQIRAAVDDLQFDLLDDTQLTLDLDGATTLGDVVDQINALDPAKLVATISADGNGIDLEDITGGGGTFSVSSVGAGTAAEDLGLTVTAAGKDLSGARLVSGLGDTLLSSLNGGQGVGPLGDIDITDRLGTPAVTVDLSSAETLGGVVDLINASAADVVATINDARNGITITDTSGGTGNFIVADSGATTTATNLGIAVSAEVASVDSGSLARQTLSEATLLSSIGSEGITPSDISITDTNGQTTSIDLNTSGSEAKTIGDVINAINDTAASSGLAVTARINDTGDGILILDTAEGSQTLGVADVNGTLAADLNLTGASKTVEINGDDTIVVDGSRAYTVDLAEFDTSAGIAFSSLNNGAGVDVSDILITDSSGKTLSLDLNGTDAGITTVGQLIDTINSRATGQGVGVTAEINSSGTGILLTDTAGGSEKLTVVDVNGTAAADLKIEGEATGTTIDGIGLFEAQDENQAALDAVAEAINALEAGVSAATIFDGVGYRLTLSVDKTGAANEILFDGGDTAFAFEETTAARDALVVLGEGAIPGSGVLISSATNDFDQVIDDVDLTVVSASSSATTVDVTATSEDLIAAVEDFVDAYNVIRSELDTQTDFNEEDFTTGLLFGTNEALRVDTELSRLVTDRFRGVGSFETLAEVGITVDGEGKLQLDQGELQAAFDDDPGSLQRLFADENSGVVAKFNDAIDRLAGADNGLLTNRSDALQNTIDSNEQRIERFNESLDRQREALLLQFFQLEQIIAGLQANQTALAGLQPVAPLTSSSSR